MGKPFASELRILPETYKWALAADVKPLCDAISGTARMPLLCIGSGGSFSAAHFTSQLHEGFFQQISKPVTPLEFIDTRNARGKAVIVLSAGGRNPDIIGALKDAILQEAAKIIVVCFQSGSRLSKLAEKFRNVDLIEYELPSGKDGFLATNSLLAFNLLLLRSYLISVSDDRKLPPSLNELLSIKSAAFEEISLLEDECRPAWQRKTLIVLHGTSAASAGIDIESKFTEAALHTTQVADYRNFAHGRHHWLAKHRDTSAVLALTTPEDSTLAKKTLELLPKNILVVELETQFSGFVGNLALLVIGFYITSFVGKAKGIDPGRPGVPPFGSKIYRLNAFGKLRPKRTELDPSEEAAICRKTQSTINHLRLDGSLAYWRKAYKHFVDELRSKYFQAIVFDYDGTLCDGHDRYTGISPEIADQLRKLLESGVTVGIATGRGKSVREVLQGKLPETTWHKILIGYYNCSDISSAADNLSPNAVPKVCEELQNVANLIADDSLLKSLSEITLRQNQITVEPISKVALDLVWDILQQKVNTKGNRHCRLVHSSHSFDIISDTVSKCDLVDRIQNEIPNSSILCIGDKGKFPGNDFQLLSENYSLSVDEVSGHSKSCWNLTPRGYRGVQGTLYYLGSAMLREGGFRIKIR